MRDISKAKVAFYCRVGKEEKEEQKSLTDEQKIVLYRILQNPDNEKIYKLRNRNVIEQLMKNEYMKLKEETRKRLKSQAFNNRLSRKPIYKINNKRNVEPNRKIINKRESR